MRHDSILKTILWLPFLLGACAWADETADRAAIGRTIAALNRFPRSAGLFTADADASVVLDRLWKGKRLAFRPGPAPGDRIPISSSDRPTVIISQEPWGEATIKFPGGSSIPPMEVLNPRIERGVIRFLTPDVALVDGACTYRENGAPIQITPLLFVMKKEGDDWKVASIRVLAPT